MRCSNPLLPPHLHSPDYSSWGAQRQSQHELSEAADEKQEPASLQCKLKQSGLLADVSSCPATWHGNSNSSSAAGLNPLTALAACSLFPSLPKASTLTFHQACVHPNFHYTSQLLGHFSSATLSVSPGWNKPRPPPAPCLLCRFSISPPREGEAGGSVLCCKAALHKAGSATQHLEVRQEPLKNHSSLLLA